MWGSSRFRPPAPPVLLSLAALAVAMVSTQFGASYAKRLFPVVGAEGAAALRVTLAAMMVTVVLRPWRRPILASAWPVIAGYGLSLGAMNLLFYLAIQRAPLGLAVALEFSGPLAVSIASSRRWSHFAWIGLAVGGLGLLLPLGQSVRPVDPLGLIFALGAGVFWGLYIVFGRRAAAVSGSQAAALGSVIAAALLFPVGLLHARAGMFSPPVFMAALLVALMSSALPYSLEMVALTRLPTRVFSGLMCLEPAVGALMGWSMLHEVLGLKSLFAIALIMLASLGTTLTLSAPVQEPQP